MKLAYMLLKKHQDRTVRKWLTFCYVAKSSRQHDVICNEESKTSKLVILTPEKQIDHLGKLLNITEHQAKTSSLNAAKLISKFVVFEHSLD